MAIEIRMPELSADVREADLVAWLVKPGDRVSEGDLIAELETDKSTVEFESPASGILREIRVPEGTSGVQVGTVLAVLEEEAEVEAQPEPQARREEPQAESGEPQARGEDPQAEPEELRAEPGEPQAESGELPATALARRIAGQHDLDLSALRGTGPGGRIVKADVESALSERPAEARPERPEAPEARERRASAEERETGGAPHTEVPHSRMRRTIAQRLAQAKREMPHFYLRAEVRVDRLLALRAKLNAESEEGKLSVNDFVVRATALALREVPAANVEWTEEAMRHYDGVDVSVAVATEAGLVTPVVRDADRKGLAAIAGETRDLAARARAGKLRPEEYRGGTVTVSNLGMYGVESVYAIVNPPQACIVGVGAAEPRAIVEDGKLGIGTVMTLTLSADHRAVDGAVGAALLGAIRRRLEDPLEMLL